MAGRRLGYAGFCGLLLGLAGCASQQSWQMSDTDKYQATRYQVDQDYTPVQQLKAEDIADAIPRKDPITKAGNKSPYSVRGQTYYVRDTHKGYKAQGGASWYGMKFHGHKTSNGELYSVYGMTAAHKTLPIPSYAKVTNLVNGKTAIVRVNDRGPFHPGRIIDLSYAAATKLGFVNQGSTQVEVEAIDVDLWHKQQHLNPGVKDWVLQVAAYSEPQIAEQKQRLLQQHLAAEVFIEPTSNGWLRLKVGPLYQSELDDITEQLLQLGFAEPLQVRL